MPRGRTPALALAALVALLTGGCELLVSNEVPPFDCSGTALGSCPPDQVCAPALGRCVPKTAACTLAGCPAGTVCDTGLEQCVPVVQVGPDASLPPADATAQALDVAVTPDTSTTRPSDATAASTDATSGDATPAVDASKCTAVGCACAFDTDCASLMCAGSNVLSSGVGTGKVCTKPCCASSECSAGQVCFAPGNGSSYCVAQAIAGRSGALGAGAGGAACTANAQCRSGSCDTNAGACLDSCCLDRDCASGSHCGLSTLTGHDVLQCVTSGTIANGGACQAGQDAQCKSGYCEVPPSFSAPTTCSAPCCTSSACGAGAACYDVSSAPGATDFNRFCAPYQSADQGSNAGQLGATCQTNADCASARCVAGQCSDACCTDADCASSVVPTWRCVSTAIQGEPAPFLRCGPVQ